MASDTTTLTAMTTTTAALTQRSGWRAGMVSMVSASGGVGVGRSVVLRAAMSMCQLSPALMVAFVIAIPFSPHAVRILA